MRMNKTLIFTLILCLPMGGCAFAPQAVKLKPELHAAGGAVGNGHRVQLTVVDERPKSTLGTRGARGVGAELTIDGDLPTIVGSAIKDGLTQQGFETTNGKTSDGRELRVEIRNLDYGVTMGFWSGDLRTQCSLKAICVKGNERPYEKLHRGEFKENVQVVQGAEANNRYVNAALSDAINQLVGDHDLVECLAQP